MRKFVITTIVLAILGTLLGYDVLRSKQFNIELVTINPDVIEADGQTEVKITTRLTDNKGKPVEGHDLFAIPIGGGSLRANRVTTDADGLVVFTYHPYRASNIMEAKDVTIRVIDESNSVFFEVNTSKEFTLHLVEPSSNSNSDNGLDFDSIFGP